MYLYDIKLPNRDQYSLHVKYGDKISAPINVSKKIGYLKKKIDEQRSFSDITSSITYVILNNNNEEVFTKTYASGENGILSEKPKQKPKQKPVYKTVYLYKNSTELVETKREDECYLTFYDVICDESGKIITDLVFLRYLSDRLYQYRAPVLIPKKLLVQIATYFPNSKEEFISLPWAGEKTYEAFGKDIVELINETYYTR